MRARNNPTWWAVSVLAGSLLGISSVLAAAALEDLADLSGKVVPHVTLKTRDTFSSEVRYEVRAKNLTGQAYHADSLLIILDKVMNVAGQEHDPVSREPLLTQVEVLEQDGETPDGKPYFHVPLREREEFAPYALSPPVLVRLRNSSFITGLAPSFRIVGQVKKVPPADSTEPRASSSQPERPAREASIELKLDALIDLLIRKGLLTDEEWRATDEPRP